MSLQPEPKLDWIKLAPTILLAVFALWFSYFHASPLPYGDEYEMVEVLVGERPADWSYFWSRHNEHRLPVPRLVMHTLLPIYRYDFRLLATTVPAILTIGLLSYLFCVSRSGRRLEWSDNAYAVLLLNPGHVENFLWGWQVQYAINIALVFFTAGILRYPRWRYAPAVCAALLFGMMGCGVNGVLTAACLWVGTCLLFGFDREWDRLSLAYALATVTGLFVAALLLRTGEPLSLNWSLDAVAGMVAFFACLAGPAAQQHWQGVGAMAMLGVSVILGVSVFRVVRHRDTNYLLPLSLGLALVLFAAAVGLLRTGGDPADAFQYRYFTLTTIWMIAAFYTISQMHEAWAEKFRWALLAIAMIIGLANVRPGFRYATAFKAKHQDLSQDISLGLPLRLIAEKYHGHPFGLYAPSSQALFERLEMLRQAGMTEIKTAKPSPTTFVIDADSGLLHFDEQTGRLKLKESASVHGITWSWGMDGANGEGAAAFGVFGPGSGERPIAGIVKRLGAFYSQEALAIDGAVDACQFQRLAGSGELMISNLKLFVVRAADRASSSGSGVH